MPTSPISSSTEREIAPDVIVWPSRQFWWLVGPIVAFLSFLPGLATYFSGEDFIFISFAAGPKAFYEVSQNLFYRPLPNLLWEFDYNLWGLQAPGYHLTNLLLHTANTALVGWLARRIGASSLAGGLATLLFALHPLHVEPVLWLAGRPDLLATLFFLLALLGWLKHIERGSRLFYGLSMLAYAASLFCKESASSLPLVLLIWALLLQKPVNKRQFLITALKIVPYLLAFGLYLAIRLNALGGIGGYGNEGRDFFYILWNATLGLWLPLLFPVNIESLGWPIGAGLGLGLLGCYGWLGWRLIRAQVKRKELLAVSGLALVLLYGSLLPALNTAPVSTNLAQSRILYLPSIGFCLLLAGLLRLDLPTVKKQKSAWLLPTLATLYLGALLVVWLPWWQASNVVGDTFRLLRAEASVPQAGDTVYYEGLPDNLRGAYVWRNGLHEATGLLLGAQIEGIHRTPEVIVDYRKAEQGRMWVVRYDLNPLTAQLMPKFTYSVINPKSVDTNSTGQTWDFAKTCQQADWQWDTGQGRLDCEAGRGLLFNTLNQKTSLTLRSPPFEINAPAFELELSAYVNYDFQQPQLLCEVYLTDAVGREYFRQPFDLGADGKNHRYRLLLPAPAGVSGLFQVNLSVYRSRTNILWQSLRWAKVTS